MIFELLYRRYIILIKTLRGNEMSLKNKSQIMLSLFVSYISKNSYLFFSLS